VPARETRTPTAEECWGILSAHGVPLHICRHSAQVAKVARQLAESLRRFAGESIDVHLVEAAALLHDIAKSTSLATRRDHAAEGGEVLKAMGYGRIAVLVEKHVHLGNWDPAGRVVEEEILNYSDKRVRHEDIVSLAERFRDLIVRYGRGDPVVEDAIRQNWRVTEAIEKKLFSRLPFAPGDIV
jgi:uncharacterized protein